MATAEVNLEMKVVNVSVDKMDNEVQLGCCELWAHCFPKVGRNASTVFEERCMEIQEGGSDAMLARNEIWQIVFDVNNKVIGASRTFRRLVSFGDGSQVG